MNKRPSFLTQLLSRLLKVLGAPAYWLVRRLGYRPTAPAQIPIVVSPVPVHRPPAEAPLPPGWTRPRSMQEAKPTLAPVLLAFGLAGAALGLLITIWSIVGVGVVLAVLGGAMWAWDSYQESGEG
ncbi:hypothetical protein GCM10022631_19810 [Deinococcus rubellus]|uniref:Cytochrome c oxidase polypeptide IV n=1 Tax=Deinococcus rubellus TaxID=1889240 RepID=A0ABY5YG06_9DEIO|nr:hypothetical protein [Deinococcus rubellus]UWX63775.1 hypothetical protein N0D28_13725 [Deinococcus rubellus]